MKPADDSSNDKLKFSTKKTRKKRSPTRSSLNQNFFTIFLKHNATAHNLSNLKAKLIITLRLYEQTFNFQLQMTTNNFTSNLSKPNRQNETGKSNQCLYTGVVNQDKHSHVFINLCQQELMVKLIFFWQINSLINFYDPCKFGSFQFNKTDYFIEPYEEHNSKLLTEQTEFSYVLIDHQIVTLKPHVIFKKGFDKLSSNYDTCALLGIIKLLFIIVIFFYIRWFISSSI